MGDFLNILLGFALAAVAIVLFTGVATFARGGDFNKKNSLKLMNLRVGAQFLALAIFGLILLLR